MPEGLENVVVTETELSEVDGANGRLIVRGHSVAELARLPLLEVASTLWRGFVPEAELEPEVLGRAFAEARERAARVVLAQAPALARTSAAAGLRLLVAALATQGEPSPAALAGAFPVFIAALARKGRGQTWLVPTSSVSPAEDLVHLLHGEPDPVRARALDAYWATVADHGMNASTFAARVIASTGAELLPGVLGALGALEGPLHGGAPGPVLDMLDQIGSADAVDAWLEAELGAGKRLMGFGHRVYRVRDPRADVLRQTAETLSSRYLELAAVVEARALARLRRHKPDRPLATNVEFYTALVLDAIGIPRDLFTATFAAGRVLGWIAHMLEQKQRGRLIRPSSRYTGPAVVDAA